MPKDFLQGASLTPTFEALMVKIGGKKGTLYQMLKNASKKHPLQNRTNVQIKGGGSKAFWTMLKKTALFWKGGFPEFAIIITLKIFNKLINDGTILNISVLNWRFREQIDKWWNYLKHVYIELKELKVQGTPRAPRSSRLHRFHHFLVQVAINCHHLSFWSSASTSSQRSKVNVWLG